MYFPTICVDNFFNNPNEVRNFALSLEYKKAENTAWPGKRTDLLSNLNSNYFDLFCRKIFSIFFDIKNSQNLYNWEVATYFQIIEPFEYDNINTGWIHFDTRCIFAGIIYLTPDISLECGTSIFKPKKSYNLPMNYEDKKEMYLNFNESNLTKYEQSLKENNDLFEETINFKNVFNRLVAYDSSQYHGVNSFHDNKVERLTQVFFINSVNSNYFPIPAMNQIQL